MKERKVWKMPTWMEPYRSLICNTGGNSIERLVNGMTDPIINLPVSTIEFGVKSQIGLLENLKAKGLLK